MMICIHFFFFNDTATTEIYTLSLHDALPILSAPSDGVRAPSAIVLGLCTVCSCFVRNDRVASSPAAGSTPIDRKSTRLNSSHSQISYAVFCLKKKKNTIQSTYTSYYI